MTSENKKYFTEIERVLSKTSLACHEIKKADTAVELRDAWEEYLNNFSKTMGRIITLGTKFPASKSFAWKVKNLSTKDDEGLMFLREARNSAEHGLKPFADFNEASVNVGGFGRFGGNSSISFSGNIVNGVDTGTFSVETKDGKISNVSGRPMTYILEDPANVILKPIISEDPCKKGKKYNVPVSLNGIRLDSEAPNSIADIGLQTLQDLFEELKTILDSHVN